MGNAARTIDPSVVLEDIVHHLTCHWLPAHDAYVAAWQRREAETGRNVFVLYDALEDAEDIEVQANEDLADLVRALVMALGDECDDGRTEDGATSTPEFAGGEKGEPWSRT